jgi:hypothetical protein
MTGGYHLLDCNLEKCLFFYQVGFDKLFMFAVVATPEIPCMSESYNT